MKLVSSSFLIVNLLLYAQAFLPPPIVKCPASSAYFTSPHSTSLGATYRVFDLHVSVDEMLDGGIDNLSDIIRPEVLKVLGSSSKGVGSVDVVRYSFDSRRKVRQERGGPVWNIVADVEVEGKVREKRGKVERR